MRTRRRSTGCFALIDRRAAKARPRGDAREFGRGLHRHTPTCRCEFGGRAWMADCAKNGTKSLVVALREKELLGEKARRSARTTEKRLVEAVRRP